MIKLEIKLAYSEFYDFAFLCVDLEKKENINRGKCAKRNYECLCSPKNCPKPGLWNHFRPPVEEPKKPVEAKEMLDLSHTQKPQLKLPPHGYPRYNPGETSVVDILARGESDASLSLAIKPEFKTRRDKKHGGRKISRPCVRNGEVKRVLVGFNQKNGNFARWGFDCVSTAGCKKPQARTLQQGKIRFYFPKDTRDEKIRGFVKAWFENQGIHDSVPLNRSGSPIYVDVNLM